jgi:hypothetical protein
MANKADVEVKNADVEAKNNSEGIKKAKLHAQR